MNIIELTRQLGAAIQKDESYILLQNAKEANDKDAGLQELIGDFNLVRLSLDNALAAKDSEDKVKECNDSLKEIYTKIMQNPVMIAYNAAKSNLDDLMNHITGILNLCAAGENPATAEIDSGCSGSCSSCEGCH